jgi:uncharacterized protein (DUF885 family)
LTAIDDLANRYISEGAALDPCLATSIGVTDHEDRLTDYSPDGLRQRADLRRHLLADLRTTPVANDEDRVTAAILADQVGTEQAIDDAGVYLSDLNTIASPLQNMRQVFDLMNTDGEDAWRTIATRIRQVPECLSGYRRSLATASSSGLTSARRQVEECARRCDKWAAPDGEGFFSGLTARYGDGPQRRELDAAAEAAAAALVDFGRFLREDLLPNAPEKDAVGHDRYALLSRYFTGTTLDLDATYAWGWDELERIEAEMRELAERILPGATIDDAIAALEDDPARRVEGSERFRDWMQRLSDRTIEAMAGVHFDIPVPVRRLECRIAPTREGGIYYTPPSEDFSRPGRMWWSVPDGVDSFSTWREVTTVFHEGVPGHHLQSGQVAFRASELNRYRRLCWNSGHGEGWALYAERLMAELGYLDEPGERMGMLDAQRFRAARVIVDIGMHLELPIPASTGFHEGERWTPALGWEFLRAHCSLQDEFLREELNRYLGWPGQAPSYKVGEREWLAARDDARRRHGSAFDLKAFHNTALHLGSMGLDTMRAELARI